MKIGYPCINRTLPCQGNKTFRLKSYTPHRLKDTIKNNLTCLQKILKYNVQHNLFFFRITSDLIPFASHPICSYPWQAHFKDTFQELGDFIKKHQIRISMHPDQFTLLNSQDRHIFTRSVNELSYHAQILDLMQLDCSHKIQIHIGGIYGDKNKSINRFITRYKTLPRHITHRLVIENDDRNYTLHDCLLIHQHIHIPILADHFHYAINHTTPGFPDIFNKAMHTWTQKDGIPMVDYSSQQPQMRTGKHAETINPHHFKTFLKESQPHEIDIMLEIKDKEISALRALYIARNDSRLFISKNPGS